jgi:AraC-like DNA-binding protein
VRNKFNNWSNWSSSVQFTIPDDTLSEKRKTSLPFDLWFSYPNDKKPLKFIFPGKWYDVHLKAGNINIFKSLSRISLILNHFSYSLSPDSWSDLEFDQRLYYSFIFEIEKQKIWFRYKHFKLFEVFGQKIDFVDNSNNQYRVDMQKSYLKARIRVSEKAVPGIWSASILPIDKQGKNYFPPKMPVLLADINENVRRGLPWKIIFPVLSVLIIISSVLLVIAKKRKQGQSSLKDNEYSAAVGRIRAVIDKEMQYPDFSLQKLAQSIGFSRDYLSRQFKKETGMSFPEFLNKRRLERAEKLIRDSDLQVSEVAYKVGYSTPEYFTKVFKSHYKCTPREFRLKQAEK